MRSPPPGMERRALQIRTELAFSFADVFYIYCTGGNVAKRLLFTVITGFLVKNYGPTKEVKRDEDKLVT